MLTSQNVKGNYDVVICGAGIAGLTLARQISRELPELSLLVIEGMGDKARTGAIQVGEATVETSAHYLANVVGLRDYLERTHYHKWGFRFFFGSGATPLHQRPEMGTSHASPLNSYQIDRALLETDIKRLNAEVGIQMLENSKVEKVKLATDGECHEITVLQKTPCPQHLTIKSRWIVDAMGRRRFLQRQLGLAQPHNLLHSGAWFRMEGRIDVCDLVPRSETEWHARVPNNQRYFSTNHLMENGRWVWLIPLASGNTSIGIVAREDFFPFHEYNTFEKALHWLQMYEPDLWRRICHLAPVDFQCLRHYSYSAQQIYSIQRWACTGDAAVFSDPFFSPGIDQAGFGNTLITEMIKRDTRHQLDAQTVERFNGTFLTFHTSIAFITQSGYPFYGDALVAGMKMAWDVMRGFSLTASARFNNTYLDAQTTEALQPLVARFFQLTLRLEKLFKDWARLTRKRYKYTFVDYFALPGMLDIYHRHFQVNRTTEELIADHQKTLDEFEELAQITFLIALADMMPEMLAQLPSSLWLNAWGIGLDPQRWRADRLFAPSSAPRPLKIREFAACFGVEDLPQLLGGLRQ